MGQEPGKNQVNVGEDLDQGWMHTFLFKCFRISEQCPYFLSITSNIIHQS